MKYLIFAFILLTSCAKFKPAAGTNPAPVPNHARTWTCTFTGMGPDFVLTIPLGHMEYDVPNTFTETICDYTVPSCMDLDINAVVRRNHTIELTDPGSPGPISFQVVNGIMTVFAPADPAMGDLICN